MDQDETTRPATSGPDAGPVGRPAPAATEAAQADRARRQEREAAALRQNLLRRKVQTRHRPES